MIVLSVKYISMIIPHVYGLKSYFGGEGVAPEGGEGLPGDCHGDVERVPGEGGRRPPGEGVASLELLGEGLAENG